jgi:HSP20 family protein
MLGNLFAFDNAFDDFRRIQDELDDLMGRRWRQGSIRAAVGRGFPPVNLGSTPEAVHVYLFAPGLDRDSIDLSIQGNVLTISGERSTEQPQTETAGFQLRERHSGKFRRTFTLPEDVDPGQVAARYRDGVLHIQVRRHESARPRQIEVQA